MSAEEINAVLQSQIEPIFEGMTLLFQRTKEEIEAVKIFSVEQVVALSSNVMNKKQTNDALGLLELKFGGKLEALREEIGGELHTLRDEFGGGLEALREEFGGGLEALRQEFGGLGDLFADALGATPMDRPEWGAVNNQNG
jgi:hypothetical protein